MSLHRFEFRAMGSPCALHLHGPSRAAVEEVAEAARGEVLRLERKYSRYRDDSLATRIQRSAGDPEGVVVDGETASLLDYAETAWRQSGGLFDITSGILRRVWDLKSGRVPAQGEVREVLRRVGWSRVRWERPRLVLPEPGMELDFGGYVKEYAVDRVTALCRGRGVRGGLVDLGGDLGVVGPHPDGSAWQIGIRDPHRPRRALARLAVATGAVASSGDYERCMIVDGRRYGHVLDPRTGWPVDGLASATAVAPHCLVAGTATTVALLKGQRAGPAWLEETGLPSLTVDRSGVVRGTLLGWQGGRSGPAVGDPLPAGA